MMTADDFERWVKALQANVPITVSVSDKNAVRDKELKEARRMLWGDPTPAPECECGSEAVGSSRHAHYCPKYE